MCTRDEDAAGGVGVEQRDEEQRGAEADHAVPARAAVGGEAVHEDAAGGAIDERGRDVSAVAGRAAGHAGRVSSGAAAGVEQVAPGAVLALGDDGAVAVAEDAGDGGGLADSGAGRARPCRAAAVAVEERDTCRRAGDRARPAVAGAAGQIRAAALGSAMGRSGRPWASKRTSRWLTLSRMTRPLAAGQEAHRPFGDRLGLARRPSCPEPLPQPARRTTATRPAPAVAQRPAAAAAA